MNLRIHMCPLDFHFIIHLITINMVHTSDVPYVKSLSLLSVGCLLGYDLSSPPHSLMMQGLQCSSILDDS